MDCRNWTVRSPSVPEPSQPATLGAIGPQIWGARHPIQSRLRFRHRDQPAGRSDLSLPSPIPPFVLLVVGYPAADATVPDIRRRPLGDIASFLPP
jgi:hypothetical protein